MAAKTAARASCLAPWAAAALLLGGCVSRPALVEQSFALRSPASNAPASTGREALAVRLIHVSPLFDDRSLVYRTGENTYEKDPYARFLVMPDNALGIPIRAWLRNSGLFQTVTEPGSSLRPGRALEVYVHELYGDFRKPGQFAAVLSLRLLLIAEDAGGTRTVLLQKDYARTAPLTANTAAAVVAGLDQALAEIMTEAVGDLAATMKAEATAR